MELLKTMLATRGIKAHLFTTVILALTVTSGCGVLPDWTALPPLEPHQVRALELGPSIADLPEVVPGGAQVGFGDAERQTLRVRNIRCLGLGTGTGFALDAHTIVTNRHVVDGMSSLELTTFDGRAITVDTVLVAEKADLAIVTTVEQLKTTAQLRDDDPSLGELVQIVGFPDGGRMTISTGTVRGFTTDPDNAAFGEVVVTDAEVAPGNSGSALLDSDGAIIGVVYAKTETGWSMAIPVTTLIDLMATDGAFVKLATCN